MILRFPKPDSRDVLQTTHTSLFILIFKRLVKDLFLSFEIYLLELSRSVYHA
jgi:hypothetical protein